MRLISTSSFEILEFNPPTIPRYAILSHTWTEDEFIFSDRDNPDRRESKGFKKISGCCALAAAEGWQFLWVDTCCIDKSSSAELTEAINSMYKWYEKSETCYVYLEDFLLESAREDRGESFRYSRWFSRGWTLQELLAPQNVVFYDCRWAEIGSKTFLRAKISNICWISPDHLSQPKNASIATKMSWASRRHTSREEDMAYSLLGLFDINMPLLYGEGDNAFYRLQCEILQSSPDESIFAWKDQLYSHSGLLAKSPSAFAESNDIVPIYIKEIARPPYSMTNKGLAIEFVVQRQEKEYTIDHDHFHAPLACARAGDEDAPVMLALRTINGDPSSRDNCDVLEFDTRKTFWSHRSERSIFYMSNTRYPNWPTIPKPPIWWLPITIKWTLSAQSELVSIEYHSEPSKSPSVKNFKYLALIALKSTSFEGHLFVLGWLESMDQGPEVYFFDMGRDLHLVNAKLYYLEDFEYLLHSPFKRVPLASTDNVSLRLESGKFLWIKTRIEYIKRPGDIEEHPRQVVEVDITSVDRSMFI